MDSHGFLLTVVSVCVAVNGVYDQENTMIKRWLDLYNKELQVYEQRSTSAEFNFLTNITADNKQTVSRMDSEKSAWTSDMISLARGLMIGSTLDEDSRRQLQIITTDATPSDPELVRMMDSIQRELQTIYGSARVCFEDGDCKNEGEMKMLMAQSRDYDTLLKAWKGFRDATGPAMRAPFSAFVKLLNIGARENGYPDMGYFWRVREMDDGNFDLAALKLYDQLKPMYVRLHAYVRHKLMKMYPGHVTANGPIPAHLLGDLWAQNWNNLIDVVAPYPEAAVPDITEALKRENYTVTDIYKVAEKFYLSIGLRPMTAKFWDNSMLERPHDGRKVACHGAAFDFFTNDDFRIKKCTQATTDDFVSVHHEMGHIEYFMHYSHLPSIFRSSPNTGFHEGVADISSLSVLTPSYLRGLNLAGKQADQKTYMNFLMEMALRKIAFLPFGLLIDLWRWEVFNGTVQESDYNHLWWKLRLEFQGVAPPIHRDENDFDPGSKAHIPHNVPYIRYFVSFISQFQFHEALCKASGHKGALYLCNIAGSSRAGTLLRRFMNLGRTKPWPEALAIMTGSRELDARPIINYFQPLIDWMDAYINQNKLTVGWDQ